MSVRIRLTRVGRKKKPVYRIIVVDREQKRDGRYLEKVGFYDPGTDPATVEFKEEAVMSWLHKGATPSDTVKSLLRKQGIWKRFSNPEAASQPAAEAQADVKIETGSETPAQPEVKAETAAEE